MRLRKCMSRPKIRGKIKSAAPPIPRNGAYNNVIRYTDKSYDNYVDTLTNTITSVIAEKVPTKSIKRNSMGLPIEIRELIRQK